MHPGSGKANRPGDGITLQRTPGFTGKNHAAGFFLGYPLPERTGNNGIFQETFAEHGSSHNGYNECGTHDG
jgi:hypothetical protein